jgi:hypothetical protein
MLINIETTQLVPAGNSAGIIHNVDNTVWMFSEIDGKFTQSQSVAPLGNWNDMTYSNVDVLISDKNVELIRCKSITDVLNIVVWKDGNSHRILAFPDDSPLYDPTAVHRLYWAVDTEKLYMNISDTWQMIGTLKHDLLNDVGTYSHNDIDNKLDYLEGKISSVEGGTFDIVEW